MGRGALAIPLSSGKKTDPLEWDIGIVLQPWYQMEDSHAPWPYLPSELAYHLAQQQRDLFLGSTLNPFYNYGRAGV